MQVQILEAFRLSPADILLVDIRMPVMDGLELIRHLNQITSNFFTSSSQRPVTADLLEDKNYLAIQDMPASITFFPREKNELYPYLITIYIPVSKSGQTSIVIVNINTSAIPVLSSAQSDSLQKIYIVSDEGKLLYRHGQESIPEPVALVPQLSLFDASVDFYSTYAGGETPYITLSFPVNPHASGCSIPH